MAARQIAQPQTADADAHEPLHFVADLVKHPANLAIDSLSQDNAQPGRPERLEAREPGAFAVEENSVAAIFGASVGSQSRSSVTSYSFSTL